MISEASVEETIFPSYAQEAALSIFAVRRTCGDQVE